MRGGTYNNKWPYFRLLAQRESNARSMVGSVVVVFELVTYRQHRHTSSVVDLVQRHVASATKRNQQLTKEGAVAGLAVDERRPAQASLDGIPNRIDGKLRGIEVLRRLGTVEQEVEEAEQVLLRRVSVPDFKRRTHPSTDLRRASRRRCSSV